MAGGDFKHIKKHDEICLWEIGKCDCQYKIEWEKKRTKSLIKCLTKRYEQIKKLSDELV